MSDILDPPRSLVGTWRRFGEVGPVYQIIGIGADLPDGERTMRVRVLETGEEVDYRLSRLVADPSAD